MKTRRDSDRQEEQLRVGARLIGAVRGVRCAPCLGFAVAALIASAPLAALDESDTSYVHPLVNQALETEKTDVEIPWANPKTGNRGVIVVERTFYRDEQPCRQYRRTVDQSGSATLVIKGVGCRVGAGRWELEEDPAARASEQKSLGVEPAAGPARQRPEPQRSGRSAPPPATTVSETQVEPETKAASDTEGASEKASAEPAATTEDTPEAAPPKPPPFPSYTMPSPAKL